MFRNFGNGDGAFLIAAYLRVGSLAVSTYDFLETYPTAFRFYREHWQSRRLTISLLLFSLLRFVSVVTLAVSNVGFFYDGFTIESCSRYYLLPPAFKVIQTMVSQAILGVRTFNLSRREKSVGWFLLALYAVASVLQWITTMYQRVPDVGSRHANCRAVNSGIKLGAWIFYAVAIIYDVINSGMSIWYLLKYKMKTKNSILTKLTRMMLYDGLGYLVLLTGVNILNVLLYKWSQEIQTAGASLGYCVAWIMSQRLLIHLYDASRERREEASFDAEVTLSKHIPSHRDVSRVIRSQFEHKSTDPFDLARTRPDSAEPGEYPEDDIGVQVRIERTVRLSRYNRTIELEDYSRRSRI